MAEGLIVRRAQRQFPFAIGGTETVIEQDGKFYRVHTYTDVGEDTFSVPRNPSNYEHGGEVEYLVVAGGGAGSGPYGGGGGAGGLRKFVVNESNNTNAALFLTAGNYAVTVGSGGALDGERNSRNHDGDPSSIAALVDVIGGGAGGGFDPGQTSGASGGSGGGAGSARGSGNEGDIGTGASPQGNNGGAALAVSFNDVLCGGGGGAGQLGGDAVVGQAGNGGDGVLTKIAGSPQFFAGGGGGGSRLTAAEGSQFGLGGAGGGGDAADGPNGTPVAGAANTGGGGGGGNGGAIGGSGIVIIRYRITQAEFEAA